MKFKMEGLAREITALLTIFIITSNFINLTESRTVAAFLSTNRISGGDKTRNTPTIPIRRIPQTSDKTRNLVDFDTEDRYYSRVPISLAAARTGKTSRNASIPTGIKSVRPAHSGQISAVVQTGFANYGRVSEQGSECGRHKACAIRETSRAMRVETLKRTILEKLKMSAPPNVTRPNLNSSSIQEWLKRYNIRPDQGEDDSLNEFDDDVSTIKRIMKIAKAPIYQPPNRKTNCCAFNFTESELQYAVTKAHLMLYIRPLPDLLNVTYRTSLVMIRRYIRPVDANSPPTFQRVKLRRVNQTAKGHWMQVDLALVKHWFMYPEENLGLDIISRDIPDLIMTSSDYAPLLDVALRSRTRQKRSAQSGLRCDAEQEETRCCMYDLPINFEEIGWDWIVFPTTYNARYCSGECAFLQLTSMRSKLIRQSDFTRQNKTSNCCVPKKMAAISLLYFDESETIIYSSVPEMEIKRCGCM